MQEQLWRAMQGAIAEGSETPYVRGADSSMPLSAAAFRRRREQGSETP